MFLTTLMVPICIFQIKRYWRALLNDQKMCGNWIEVCPQIISVFVAHMSFLKPNSRQSRWMLRTISKIYLTALKRLGRTVARQHGH